MTAWLLLFVLTPPLGALLYLAFGSRKLRQKAARKPKPAARPAGAATPRAAPAINGLDRLIQAHGLPAATERNAVVLYGTAAAAYDAVLDLIARAEESLWVATYILGTDRVAGEILRRLAARAAAGVQVRLLVPTGRALRELHGDIQVAMGWKGIHLFQLPPRRPLRLVGAFCISRA